MKTDVRFSRNFRKQYRRASPKVQRAFERRLRLFMSNQQHSLLRNHKLSGKYIGRRSINITGDWRAVYTEQRKKDGNVNIKQVVTFQALGTHSQLYKT